MLRFIENEIGQMLKFILVYIQELDNGDSKMTKTNYEGNKVIILFKNCF